MRRAELAARVQRLERKHVDGRVVVVELREGEAQVDALRRHQSDRPEDVGASTVVFLRKF